MKLISALILLVALTATAALAFEAVSVKDGDYRMLGVSPRGANVTWAWRVKLSNDVGEPQDVKLTVQLVDYAGYEVAKVKTNVRLDMWETKEVSGQKKLNRNLWEKVTSANYVVEPR